MNNEYEILTPDGFKPFYGILQKETDEIITIKTETFSLSGTKDHLVKTNRGFLPLSILERGSMILTEHGFQPLISITTEMKKVLVYDALEVEDNKCYYTNSIVSHNCEFLGSSNTLISGECLERLTFIDPIYSDDYNNLYEKPKPGNTYVCFVDVRRRRRKGLLGCKRYRYHG